MSDILRLTSESLWSVAYGLIQQNTTIVQTLELHSNVDLGSLRNLDQLEDSGNPSPFITYTSNVLLGGWIPLSSSVKTSAPTSTLAPEFAGVNLAERGDQLQKDRENYARIIPPPVNFFLHTASGKERVWVEELGVSVDMAEGATKSSASGGGRDEL